MSEENTDQSAQQDPNQKPSQVAELEKSLNEFTQYKGLLRNSLFAGAHSKVVGNLTALIDNLYNQLLAQYKNNDWVKEQIRQSEEMQAAQAASEAKQVEASPEASESINA